MNKVKKILMMVLSLVLVAALSIGGTVAYLQDDDSDVNVMTLGSVKIAQHEYERVVDANGNYTTIDVDGTTSYKLKDFTQGKALLPCTELDANGQPYNFGAGDYDTIRVKMSQVGSQGTMDVFKSKNAQDKFVTVENTGRSDAYVRTLFAFELGSLSEDAIGDVIRKNNFMTAQGVWKVTDVGPVVINGNNYFVSEYIYNGGADLGGVHAGFLPAGETTYPSLAQVYMTSAATNEDCEKIDGNNNGTYDILVLSQAVQADGFADAETALNAGFGDANAANAATWFGGVELTPTRNPATFTVATTEEAQAALDAAIPGDTIEFVAGNTYDMLYFRQSEASEIVHDRDFLQSVYDEVKLRTFKDLTINGNGAKIAGFATEAGSYYNVEHSNKDVYPILESFIVMENVKIDGFTFDGTANAFDFVGKNAIDGLTISNCKMPQNAQHNWEYTFVNVNADCGKVDNVNGETFVVKFANVTIDKCSADYVDRFILAFFSENLTVTNNKASNTTNHFANLQGGTYWDNAHTGTITITDNDFTNGHDRFFRAAKVGNAHLVLERNDVFNPFWQNTEPDSELVKVGVVNGTSFTYTDVDNGFGTLGGVVVE